MVSGLREGASPNDRPDPKLERHRISFEVDGETYALWRAKRLSLDNERGQRMTDIEVVQAISRVDTTGDGSPSPTLHAVTTCRVCKQSSLVAGGIVTPLSDVSRERLLCDSADAGDLESEELTRLTYDIPPSTRRKVLIRDQFACTVPGCTSARHVDIHHIVLRSQGGDHTLPNLTTVMRRSPHGRPRGGPRISPVTSPRADDHPAPYAPRTVSHLGRDNRIAERSVTRVAGRRASCLAGAA